MRRTGDPVQEGSKDFVSADLMSSAPRDTVTQRAADCPAQGGRPARLRRCGGQPSHGRLICKQIGFSPCGVFPEECSAFFWSCSATPLAGEHNPCCSHPQRKSIVRPRSSPEECSAFFGSCSATPADCVASAETCDELRRRRSSSVCRADAVALVTCKQRSKRA